MGGWIAAFALGICGFFLCIGLAVTMAGCEAQQSVGRHGEWILVDHTHEGVGIYKKRCEKEKVTFYMVDSRYPSIAAVKD